MIGIVDYGLGNILAIVNIYKQLSIEAAPARTVDAIQRADRIILPGVGSFDWAMHSLERAGMTEMLDQIVRVEQRPVLGICVGMQMMARSSDEGHKAGLGWIDAKVMRFPTTADGRPVMLPHMGWNDIEPCKDSGLMSGLGKDTRFYFLHSYYFSPNSEDVVVATAQYGQRFACCVQSKNIFGVQFHPEKSHAWGVELLRNFSKV